MRPLLVILNPRRIPECLAAFDALTTPRAYLTGYTEAELVPIFANLVETTPDRTHYLVISDDGIVKQRAVNRVCDALRAGLPVATGWCNLDATLPEVNLTSGPLRMDYPHPAAYDLRVWSDVMGGPEYQQTWFAGMCLTGMSRDMWHRYPFACYGDGAGNGSDFSLCKRLQDDDVPIMAVREAFVHHLKEVWNQGDQALDKRMYLGVDQGVTFSP